VERMADKLLLFVIHTNPTSNQLTGIRKPIAGCIH
jgi:hypothetical protein